MFTLKETIQQISLPSIEYTGTQTNMFAVLESPENRIWIYAGIGVAIYVGILVLIIVIRRFKRQSRRNFESKLISKSPKNDKMTQTLSEASRKKYSNNNEGKDDDDWKEGDKHVIEKNIQPNQDDIDNEIESHSIDDTIRMKSNDNAIPMKGKNRFKKVIVECDGASKNSIEVTS